MTRLDFDHTEKQFLGKRALQDLTLSLEGEKIIGLLGRNGAGKTTAMKLAAGFLKPTGGEVRAFGEPVFNSLLASANTIYMAEDIRFPDTLSLAGILDELARAYPNFDRKLAGRLADYFSLPSGAKHAALSKGMKNTFNLIAGLAARCPLTLLDEPLNGMDAVVRKDLTSVLLKEFIEAPRMIVLSGHQLQGLEELFEEVAILQDGRLRHHGEAESFRERFKRLTGRSETVRAATAGLHVRSRRETLPGMEEAIVELEPGTIFAPAGEDLAVSSLFLNDAYIAFTGGTEGGIDRVYADQTESEDRHLPADRP
ncbi:ATP-binding cassette domain-containing protein [Bhargavaea cecembensis]|uniref:ATP-binding cassette domain-containing protein n=1 Tax=Bhargavaea cecembensis TaxID=394098 RepID=UPI0006937597|nr:ABC transporter ATP-binding protein [Bhargavaea cecembensis]